MGPLVVGNLVGPLAVGNLVVQALGTACAAATNACLVAVWQDDDASGKAGFVAGAGQLLVGKELELLQQGWLEGQVQHLPESGLGAPH